MRQNLNVNKKDVNNVVILSTVAIAILIIFFIGYSIYKANTENEEEVIDESTKISSKEENSEIVSTQIGKTIEDVEEEEEDEEEQEESNTNNPVSLNNENIVNNTVKNNTSKPTVSNIKKDDNSKIEDKKETETSDNKEKSDNNETLKCTSPIAGEVLRNFAIDELVYSETLQEWITHNGIDIKADKTSVVSSIADGTVYAIKNDPRYGLSVIINHDNGFQSIYSNLLTAEFVVEGEEIKQGQTIGTVGNSASFEIADDYHLHLELLKDGKYVNPLIYFQQ